jgi:hypothetical protein
MPTGLEAGGILSRPRNSCHRIADSATKKNAPRIHFAGRSELGREVATRRLEGRLVEDIERLSADIVPTAVGRVRTSR